jgi:CubicO group peptidase (beta-lactamase class C family)
MRNKTYLLLLLLSCAFGPLMAQRNEPGTMINKVENGLRPDANIIFADSVVKQFNLTDRMNYYGVPSVSIAVIHNGKLKWAKAYGLADDATKRAADVHTLYQAASTTKSINALCIMKLVQDGKLSLDKDIRGYLKTWTFPDNELSKNKTITLKNLLSHTAGLSTGGFKGYTRTYILPTINEILDGKLPANSEAVRPVLVPGTQSQYSGGGILVTQKILLDNVTSNYTALLNKTVLQPLGMTGSTFAQPLPANYKDFAVAYDSNRKPFEGKYYIYPEQAPDGLWTTPTDYSQFILSLQRSLDGKSGLLNKTMAEEMITPVLPGSDAALGVFIKEKGGEKYFYHTGANMGYRSIYYGSCATGNGVVVMINSDNAQILDEIVNSVAVAYGWKDFYNPEVRKLTALPDSLAARYAGEYHSDQPAFTIKVRRQNGMLELSARGDGNFEKMYFTSPTVFFLASAPDTYAEVLSADQGKTYTLQVKQGGRVLFTAKKQ